MIVIAQFDPTAATQGIINTTVLPGQENKVLLVNLSMVSLLLTLPSSDTAVLGPGQRRIFPTNDWPKGVVTWQQIAQAFQNIGQSTTFPVLGNINQNFVANALSLVYVELYEKDEDIDLSTPWYISPQVGVANTLSPKSALAGVAQLTQTFTGATPPNLAPTPISGGLFYLDGWSLEVTPLAAGIPRLITVTLTNLDTEGSGTQTFTYWLDYDRAVQASQQYPYPGLASLADLSPVTVSAAFSGNLGGGAQGTLNMHGRFVPLGG